MQLKPKQRMVFILIAASFPFGYSYLIGQIIQSVQHYVGWEGVGLFVYAVWSLIASLLLGAIVELLCRKKVTSWWSLGGYFLPPIVYAAFATWLLFSVVGS